MLKIYFVDEYVIVLFTCSDDIMYSGCSNLFSFVKLLFIVVLIKNEYFYLIIFLFHFDFEVLNE